MSISTEALLMLGALAMYLYDSVLLLHRNEGVLIAGWRGRWQARLGSEAARVAGRLALLPNPLRPHAPIFRLAWNFETVVGPVGSDDEWPLRALELQALAPFVWGMAAALFIMLPAGLFTRLSGYALLMSIFFLYANIIGALLWVYRHRAKYGLTRKGYAALAFESLAAAPTALNLVRKLALRVAVVEDFTVAARRLQAPEDWEVTRGQCSARLDEELEAEDDEAERATALRARRDELAEEEAPCP